MDLVATGRPEELLPNESSGPRSTAWWGMVLLIATEATLFALLIASYWYLRFRAGGSWPPSGIAKPELKLPIVMSAILIGSSIPAHVAARGIQRGSQARLRAGLFIAFCMGVAFFVMETALDYPEKLKVHPPSSGAYGTMYFALTGLHLLHLLVGILIGVWVQVRAWHGAFTATRHVTVQNFSMYWHFVDAVWVFVFLTVFLSPHLR